MKFINIISLAASATALVVPEQSVFAELAIEENYRDAQVVNDQPWSKDSVLKGFKDQFESVTDTVKEASEETRKVAGSVIDDALSLVSTAGNSMTETAFDTQSWLQSNVDHLYEAYEDHHHGDHDHKRPGHGHDGDHPHHPPHHGPPHHGPPHHGDPHHHHEPNETVYQLIAGSKYTTRLTALMNDYPDLVEALNGTKANYTVFAPIDSAFEKIPDHAPKPSKEQLKKLLSYHVSPKFYPAGRILVTHTIPTLYIKDHLADEPEPQRLSINIGLRGLTVNFYSRVVGANFFGTNGVIHAVDSILVPPPNVIKIIDLLPTEFSTLELGLGKTGLLEKLNSTDHPGGTFFAPSNFAFQKLGPRINAFLFSQIGEKYLKALLQYHIVPGISFYSDAIYRTESEDSVSDHKGHVPKGYYHYDFPTFLEDRKLAVDVARYGGFISIKINAFSRVSVQDGIASDGVIQVVSDVLIPPKNAAGLRNKVTNWWNQGKEMSVEEFKERLEPHMSSPCH